LENLQLRASTPINGARFAARADATNPTSAGSAARGLLSVGPTGSRETVPKNINADGKLLQ